MSLFRKEAVTHQSQRLAGSISLAQPLSINFTVSALAIVAICIIAFLFSAQYSRKETVRGFLKPNKGVIKTFAQQGGTVENLYVKEGDSVVKGQTIASVIIRNNTLEGQDVNAQMAEHLRTQEALLNDEIAQLHSLQAQEINNLHVQLASIKQQTTVTQSQLHIAKEKLTLLNEQQNKFKQLNQQGYLSNLDKDRQHHALLEAKQEIQNLQRTLLQQQTNSTDISFKSASIPEHYTLKINQLKRQLADVKRQLTQVSIRHKYTVTASHDGTVTAIQVVEGETISANRAQVNPILLILPKESELIAELLLPTRSAGFVQVGNNTRLRFDAFPYQRFGFVESEVVMMDKAVTSPQETQLPINFKEPVYRIKAKLNKQQIQAFGKAYNLKSGMLLEADIMLENRSLMEWLLAPLYSLKGRIS